MSRRKQFFHGGAANLEPGDLVLPSRYTGQPNTGNGTSYAWASTDPKEAVNYAGYARSDSGEGHVYRVRPIDGDSQGPDDAHGKFAQGREAGWLVEGHAWDTGQRDWDRSRRVAQGNATMSGYRNRRLKRQAAYDRDSKLNPAERDAKRQALDEVSPEHRERSRQFDQAVRELTELLAPTW